MHVGKLMARLNPKNVRFDVGSGGIPEMTSTDIAGALGMVPAGLGRELMCRMWWPDGARLTAHELAGLLERIQREEWSRREARMLDAMLAVASHTGGESMRRAQSMYAAAHAERWPRWVLNAETGTLNPVYVDIRRCVVMELIEPKHCPACSGRGMVRTPEGNRDCERCDGNGTVAYGNTRRAKHLHVIESAYRQTWERPYNWLLEHVTDELLSATRAMERAAA